MQLSDLPEDVILLVFEHLYASERDERHATAGLKRQPPSFARIATLNRYFGFVASKLLYSQPFTVIRDNKTFHQRQKRGPQVTDDQREVARFEEVVKGINLQHKRHLVKSFIFVLYKQSDEVLTRLRGLSFPNVASLTIIAVSFNQDSINCLQTFEMPKLSSVKLVEMPSAQDSAGQNWANCCISSASNILLLPICEYRFSDWSSNMPRYRDCLSNICEHSISPGCTPSTTQLQRLFLHLLQTSSVCTWQNSISHPKNSVSSSRLCIHVLTLWQSISALLDSDHYTGRGKSLDASFALSASLCCACTNCKIQLAFLKDFVIRVLLSGFKRFILKGKAAVCPFASK